MINEKQNSRQEMSKKKRSGKKGRDFPKGLVIGKNSIHVAPNNLLRVPSTVTTFIYGYAALSLRAA